MKGLWFSVWAASCIALGLLMAYIDGISMRGIIFGAMTGAIMVAAVTALTYISRLWKRKRSLQHGKRNQSPKQQEADEEATNAADFKGAAMMLGGASFGYVISMNLFTEIYAHIACGIVGGATVPLSAMWRNRQMRKQPGKD